MTWTNADFIRACAVIIIRGTKPTLRQVRPLVKAYYEMDGNGIGGSLHSVLDDGYCDRGNIEVCRELALERVDVHGAVMANVLLLCSETQVKKMARFR